jgi:hypothetical protein
LSHEWGFGHLDFEHLKIVSDLDIRISDLNELRDYTLFGCKG